MRLWSPRATALLWLLAASLFSACAAPPNKEIADAQTALAAARAAGAERYAAKTYQAASLAYKLANDAVMAGDYRLALNRALESRDQAQTAARESADEQTRARDEVQRAMTDAFTLLSDALAKVDAAEKSGAPRRAVRDARQALAQMNDDVQKAGAAMKAEDYAGARPLLASVKARLTKTLASLAAATPAQSRKPRT
jgi:hypothetical protein